MFLNWLVFVLAVSQNITLKLFESWRLGLDRKNAVIQPQDSAPRNNTPVADIQRRWKRSITSNTPTLCLSAICMPKVYGHSTFLLFTGFGACQVLDKWVSYLKEAKESTPNSSGSIWALSYELFREMNKLRDEAAKRPSNCSNFFSLFQSICQVGYSSFNACMCLKHLKTCKKERS